MLLLMRRPPHSLADVIILPLRHQQFLQLDLRRPDLAVILSHLSQIRANFKILSRTYIASKSFKEPLSMSNIAVKRV